MVPQTTTSAGLEAYLANPSRRISDHSWQPLVVRSRIEPARQDALFLPATPDPWIVAVISERRRIEVRRGGRWHASASGPGQVALTAAGSSNEVRWLSEGMAPVETLHICIDCSFLAKLSSELDGGPPPEIRNMLAESDSVLATLAHLLKQELFGDTAACRELFVQGAAQMLGARLLQQYAAVPLVERQVRSGLTPSQMRRVRDYVDDNPGMRIQLDDLARIAGASPYHFARMFKRTSGLTPHRYVANVKFEHAKQLLVEKRWPVKRVAQALGFRSAAHFSIGFKAHTGRAPAEFRRSG